MTSIQSVGNHNLRNLPVPVENDVKNNYRVSFKNDGNDRFVRNKQSTLPQNMMNPQQAHMMRMMDEQRKEQKKQKLKQNLSWGIGIVSGLAIIAMVAMQMKGMRAARGGSGVTGNGNDSIRSMIEQNAVIPKPVDLSSKTTRAEGCYSDESLSYFKRLRDLLTRTDAEAKGEKRVAQVVFLGPGGTGKTDSAYQTGRIVEEIFPGSEFYMPDLSMLTSSSYRGQDVQMLTEYTEAFLQRSRALKEEGIKTGKRKYAILFLDEYDKIAMKDNSLNQHDSNKTIGALKTLINKVKDEENVILISATNYPDLIEGAIDSRVAEKVLFDYLTPKQIITAITEYYKGKKQPELFAEELKDPGNKVLEKIFEIVAKPEHELEYRKFFDNSILRNAWLYSPNGEKTTLKHLVDAITDHSAIRSLKLTDTEVTAIKNCLTS